MGRGRGNGIEQDAIRVVVSVQTGDIPDWVPETTDLSHATSHQTIAVT